MATGGRVDSLPKPTHHLDGQADLLLHLPDCSLLGRLARLDVAARPRPLGCAVAEPAPDHEEPGVLDDVAGCHERASVSGEVHRAEVRRSNRA